MFHSYTSKSMYIFKYAFAYVVGILKFSLRINPSWILNPYGQENYVLAVRNTSVMKVDWLKEKFLSKLNRKIRICASIIIYDVSLRVCPMLGFIMDWHLYH